MKVDKVYIDLFMLLRYLVEKLELQFNKLLWLFNEQIGKNFNEYINIFWLIIFKEKVLNLGNSYFIFLGLVYESGFNFKMVFNVFFKKMEGMILRVWVNF